MLQFIHIVAISLLARGRFYSGYRSKQSNFYCQPKRLLYRFGGKGQNFAQDSIYLVLMKYMDQKYPFLVCIQKHVLKFGAPPDNFGVLLPMKLHAFKKRKDF